MGKLNRIRQWRCANCRASGTGWCAVYAGNSISLSAGFDEQVSAPDPDFGLSGLTGPSLLRLSFLQSVPLSAVMGRIGAI
jgi:hypothetical protein